MNKTQAISQAIAAKINSVATVNGWAFNDAKAVKIGIDHVLGAGTYDRLVSETYDALRAA